MYHRLRFNPKVEVEEQPEISDADSVSAVTLFVFLKVLTGLKEQGRFQEVQIMHLKMSIRELDCLSAKEDLCVVVKM
ncbi:hypothetical protein L6452_30891 [Arctium lappa]|uniref:Uncharacterized protein n=1 Tax=Arctium lappa TaxID=4217 RepID=A0ACB8ZKE1_ARCLA|nr:hypothetical protein L6452_30891 [Arctium lappa]